MVQCVRPLQTAPGYVGGFGSYFSDCARHNPMRSPVQGKNEIPVSFFRDECTNEGAFSVTDGAKKSAPPTKGVREFERARNSRAPPSSILCGHQELPAGRCFRTSSNPDDDFVPIGNCPSALPRSHPGGCGGAVDTQHLLPRGVTGMLRVRAVAAGSWFPERGCCQLILRRSICMAAGLPGNGSRAQVIAGNSLGVSR